MKTIEQIVEQYGDMEFYLSTISVPTYKEDTCDELCADFCASNRSLSIDSGILWLEIAIDQEIRYSPMSLREIAKCYSIIGVVVDIETYPNEDLIDVGTGCGYIYLVK